MGRGPSWKECQFRTPELWGCATNLMTEGLKDKPYTKVFAFDGLKSNINGKTVDETELIQALEIARSRNIPIVSQRDYATELFPMVAIAREFKSSYWMPTISYAIAYALYLGYERIWIDGIDQGPRWDYQSGKSHIVFWLGVATGRKVDLRLGRGSLGWAYRLGLNELPEAFFKPEDIARHIGIEIRNEEIECVNEVK